MNFAPRRLPAFLLLSWLWPLFVSAADDLAAQVRSLYERGDYAGAARIAEAAEPSADVIFYHGLALARLERFEQARTVLQLGRDRYPLDPRFLLELAGVAYRRKHMPEAKSLLREALRLDPANQYGNDFLGTLYLLEDNMPAALKYWNQIDKPVIQDVLLASPPALDPVLRERTIAISGGQVFTLARLHTTQGNLDRLGIFSSRRIELTPRQDQRFDVTLHLFHISPSLTGWVQRLIPIVRGLPYQAIHFDRYNIGERAIIFRSIWRWDPDKRRIGMELTGPIRLNPQRTYRLLVDARDEDWDLRRTYRGPMGALDHVKTRKIEAGGDLIFVLSDKLEWTTGLRFARRQFRNHDGASIFAGGWSFEQRNQFDYRLLAVPEYRFRIDSSALLTTGRVLTAAPSRFAMLEGTLSGFWTPQAKGDTWRVQAHLRAGKTLGAIPFDKFFQLGVERDNDLWLRGHVGTRDGRKGNAPLGRNYVLLQTGLDRTIAQFLFLRVQAGPFFDAGWIGGPSGRFGSQGWLPDTGLETKVSAGGGITWSLVFGRDLRGGSFIFYTAVSR